MADWCVAVSIVGGGCCGGQEAFGTCPDPSGREKTGGGGPKVTVGPSRGPGRAGSMAEGISPRMDRHEASTQRTPTACGPANPAVECRRQAAMRSGARTGRREVARSEPVGQLVGARHVRRRLRSTRVVTVLCHLKLYTKSQLSQIFALTGRLQRMKRSWMNPSEDCTCGRSTRPDGALVTGGIDHEHTRRL